MTVSLSQTVELTFECLDNVSLTHPSAAVSVCCFIDPAGEDDPSSTVRGATPYFVPFEQQIHREALCRPSPTSKQRQRDYEPSAFVDLKAGQSLTPVSVLPDATLSLPRSCAFGSWILSLMPSSSTITATHRLVRPSLVYSLGLSQLLICLLFLCRPSSLCLSSVICLLPLCV